MPNSQFTSARFHPPDFSRGMSLTVTRTLSPTVVVNSKRSPIHNRNGKLCLLW
ncbi:hypothetical protein QUB80_24805 [Chlorogloeopsis sp. ULAP01]|nr:hypothetical protein [Chlorogloeopsis sp. ULAP01]